VLNKNNFDTWATSANGSTSIKGLGTSLVNVQNNMSSITTNMNTLGEAVELNATKISANASAIDSTQSTVTSVNSRLVSTIERVNEFTSCDGVQQCYNTPLSTGSGITMIPGPTVTPGGDFTWSPTNP
jgi:hypothetical protein